MPSGAESAPPDRTPTRGGEAGSPRRDWRRLLRTWRPDLIAFGVYIALGIYICSHYWVDINHRVSLLLPTDHTWFEWLLSHGAYSVRHLSNPLFSARQNAPDGVNMMANTSVLGITIPLAPLTMLFGPQVTYSLYLGGALAGTAASMYWVLSRHVVTSRIGAFLGGAFVGFAPGIVHHVNGQPNFATNFMLPLIALWVFKLGRPDARWVRDGVILGLMVAYQVFLNEELLLITALGLGLTVLVYTVMRWSEARARARRFLFGLGLAVGVALVLTAYPIWFQFRGPQSYHGVQQGIFHSWGEDLWAYVSFSRDSIGGVSAIDQTIGRTEQNSWFGWPLVVLAIVAIVVLWRRSLLVRIGAVVAVISAIAAIGPAVRFHGRLTGIPGPWAPIPRNLPLVEMMMPSRLSLIIAGVIGVLIAVTWEEIGRIARESGTFSEARQLRVFAFTAVVIALVPLIPRPVQATHVDLPPHFITSGGWRPYVTAGHTLVPVPIPTNLNGLSTLRWSALTEEEFPIPDGYFLGPDRNGRGYFGGEPRPTALLIDRVASSGKLPEITPAMRQQARDDLSHWQASVIVLGAHRYEAALRDLVTQLVGAPGRAVDDVWLWEYPGA
jgi:hypothetical protein